MERESDAVLDGGTMRAITQAADALAADHDLLDEELGLTVRSLLSDDESWRRVWRVFRSDPGDLPRRMALVDVLREALTAAPEKAERLVAALPRRTNGGTAGSAASAGSTGTSAASATVAGGTGHGLDLGSLPPPGSAPQAPVRTGPTLGDRFLAVLPARLADVIRRRPLFAAMSAAGVLVLLVAVITYTASGGDQSPATSPIGLPSPPPPPGSTDTPGGTPPPASEPSLSPKNLSGSNRVVAATCSSDNNSLLLQEYDSTSFKPIGRASLSIAPASTGICAPMPELDLAAAGVVIHEWIAGNSGFPFPSGINIPNASDTMAVVGDDSTGAAEPLTTNAMTGGSVSSSPGNGFTSTRVGDGAILSTCTAVGWANNHTVICLSSAAKRNIWLVDVGAPPTPSGNLNAVALSVRPLLTPGFVSSHHISDVTTALVNREGSHLVFAASTSGRPVAFQVDPNGTAQPSQLPDQAAAVLDNTQGLVALALL